jgi:hypothetical protein
MRRTPRDGRGIAILAALPLVAAAVALTPSAVRAQGVYGSTGLFVHATAGTQEPGSFVPSASYLVQENGDRTTKWRPLGLTYGVSPRLQLGAQYLRVSPEGAATGKAAGGFAKYRFRDDGPSWRRPALAGVVNFLSGDLETQQFSLVASHAAYRGPRDPARRPFLLGHVGLEVTRWNGLNDFDDRTGTSLYAGIEYPLSDRLRAIGEVGTKFRFDRSARSGIGLSYAAPGEGISLSLGAANSGQGKGLGFFVGIGFPFGIKEGGKGRMGGGTGSGSGTTTAKGFPFGGKE